MDAPVVIAREAVPSVAFLRSRIPPRHASAAVLGDERLGAGVAVDVDRVLTAHYLVLGAGQMEISGSDGRPRTVVHTTVDHDTGLALVTTSGAEWTPAPLCPHAAHPGLPVFLITSDSEKERQGASGHVVAVTPFEAFWEYMLDDAILTNVLNPGLAGAPLFDPQGRVLGIVSLGLTAVGRYSLAIPIDLYLRQRAAMEAGEPRRERMPRAWIGCYSQVQDATVVVTGLVPEGPADRAGLQPDDVLLTLDGEPLASLRELYTALWQKRPGAAVDLQVLRDGHVRLVEVHAGDRYDFYK